MNGPLEKESNLVLSELNREGQSWATLPLANKLEMKLIYLQCCPSK
jgi:hypothetical protein